MYGYHTRRCGWYDVAHHVGPVCLHYTQLQAICRLMMPCGEGESTANHEITDGTWETKHARNKLE